MTIESELEGLEEIETEENDNLARIATALETIVDLQVGQVGDEDGEGSGEPEELSIGESIRGSLQTIAQLLAIKVELDIALAVLSLPSASVVALKAKLDIARDTGMVTDA